MQRITTEIQKQLTRTLQTKSPHPRVKSAVGGYRMFLFQDFTGVLKFALSWILIPWGVWQGMILKVDYTLLVIAVATGCNGKRSTL